MGFTLDVQGQLCTFVFSDSALLLTVHTCTHSCSSRLSRRKEEIEMSAVSCSKTTPYPNDSKCDTCVL